jgi:hypothetical protein
MTKEVFEEVEVIFDKYLLNNEKSPQMVKTGYTTIKEMVKKYGNLEARARAAQQ